MLRLVGVCAAALLLAGCSSDGADQVPSMLDRFPERRACELVSDASIEKAFDAEIEDKSGIKVTVSDRERGTMAQCTYQPELVEIRLHTTDQGLTDQQILDRGYTDMTKEWQPVMAYEDVPGLGASAGFGRNATPGNVDWWELAVLFDIDGERLELTLTVEGDAAVELDQLRPLAEEALSTLRG